MQPVSIFWFRRDLRLEDNHGLYRALNGEHPVLSLFIFDPDILDLLEDRHDHRVNFIHRWLQKLHQQLREMGSSLMVRMGQPYEAYQALLNEYDVRAVFTNEDYEPFALARDEKVAGLMKARGIPFHAFKDQAVFARDEVLKGDGSPYTVFTPYSRKWHETLRPQDLASFDCASHHQQFLKVAQPFPFPELDELGFHHDGHDYDLPEAETLDITHYDSNRDRPDLEKTTQLGAHLRFGTVSVRRLARWGGKRNAVWLNQLVWRDFFFQILMHFPHVVDQPFRDKYQRIPWRNDSEEFARWCEGRTGYPMVDAGMRQLNETGYMHNRVRMITASFLCKHLLIDWRWGERYFAAKLMDFDLAANNGNWQWAAGTGCDAAPYFRVFNPYRQAEKFDPKRDYVKRWVPELDTPAYPEAMVEHSKARTRALDAYKQGIELFEVGG